MIDFILIIISTFIMSLLSFIGIITISMNDDLLQKIVVFLVSLSAGALLGGGFIHLLPEAIEVSSSNNIIDTLIHVYVLEPIGAETGWGPWAHFILENIEEMTGITILPHTGIDINLFVYVIVGFTIFFLVEKVLHWRHCHKTRCEIHTFAYMNLLGDSVHNFIDGLITAASFVASIPLGIITSIAIASHELPQEIGDFGVLIHGGFKRRRALLLNFVVALTAIAGGIIGYFIVTLIKPMFLFLLPFAAGGFFYIAATDLVPELKKEEDTKKSAFIVLIFIAGIVLMWFVKLFFHA
ncbi:MAG: ZIP family metal transporter [Candidatus Helarchaeota archaeon]